MPESGKEQTAAEKANLARIRDNQRRSRARRKEYLEELEHRVREYQAQGVEASAEIQLAARKVAEENKLLRLLLNKHGVSDDAIDGFVHSTSTSSPTSSSFDLLSPARSVFDVASPARSAFDEQGIPRQANSVQKIEQLLMPKRPAVLELERPLSALNGRSGRSSRHGSISALSGAASSPKRHTPQRSLDINLPARPRFATANSFNNHSTPPGFVLGLPPKAAKTMPTTPQQQGIPPTPDSTEPSPGFDLPLDWKSQSELEAASFLNMDRSFAFSPHTPYDASPSMYQHHFGEMAGNYMAVPVTPVTAAGNTSCGDIISTMAAVDPQHVRAGMGCATGMDCQMDDFTFNGTMDRYAAMSMPI